MPIRNVQMAQKVADIVQKPGMQMEDSSENLTDILVPSFEQT